MRFSILFFLVSFLYCNDIFAGVSIFPFQKNTSPMQPVLIDIVIENTGSSDKYFLVPVVNRFGKSGIDFFVQNPGQNTFQHVQNPDIYVGAYKSQAPPKTLQAIKLLPNQKYESRYSLTFDFSSDNRYEWLFSIAGEYKVKISVYEVEYSGGSLDIRRPTITHIKRENKQSSSKVNVPVDSGLIEVSSNYISVNVVGVDESQVTAFQEIPRYFLMYDLNIYSKYIDDVSDTFDGVSDFLNQYPDSYLSSHTNLFLANHAAITGDSDLAKQFFEKALISADKAAKYLINKRMSALGIGLKLAEGPKDVVQKVVTNKQLLERATKVSEPQPKPAVSKKLSAPLDINSSPKQELGLVNNQLWFVLIGVIVLLGIGGFLLKRSNS